MPLRMSEYSNCALPRNSLMVRLTASLKAERWVPLSGVLSVDKRIKLLAILAGVGDHHLYIVALQMYYGVERLIGHVFLQQILEAAAPIYFLPLNITERPVLREGIIFDQRQDMLVAVAVVAEDRCVGGEAYHCAVGLRMRALCRLSAAMRPHRILHTLHLAVAHTLDHKRRKRAR